MRRNEGKLFDFFNFVRVRSQSYLTTNVYFSSRQGQNDHKGDSEINKVASPVTKGKVCFQRARWPLPKAMRAGPPKTMVIGMPSKL